MTTPLQPVSLSPLTLLQGQGPLSPGAMQKAMSLNPSLAVQAAGQLNPSLPGMASSQGLNPLVPALNPLNGKVPHSDAQIRKVSHDFEAIFMRMMLKEMRNSVEKSGLMGNSSGLEFFETMRDEQLADQLSKSGGIGIGKMVYDKLKTSITPHLRTYT